MPLRILLLLALLLPLLSIQPARAQTGGAATLTILAGAVQVLPGGSAQPQTASDGMNLAVGDRVLTGPDATALVTFLDGSTLTVQPGSDIAVKSAEAGAGRPSLISIQINLGTVWARVVRLLDPRSSFSLESNTAIASTHDGEIGAEMNPDGSFVCWTREGELTVTPRSGVAPLTLLPGGATTVAGGQISGPRSWVLQRSQLQVSAPNGVLPLVLMPDGARLIGFTAPDLEVNQVFGSHAEERPDGSRQVEVPAGQAGLYTLLFEAQHDGPFQVDLRASFDGNQVAQRQLSTSLKAGERSTSQVSVQLEPTSAANPREARLLDATVTPLQAYSGPLPGKLPAAPGAAAGGSARELPTGPLLAAVALVMIVLLGAWLRGRGAAVGRVPTSS